MNPFLKTLVVTLVGAAGPAVLTAIDHPTGGFAAYLSSHPAIAGFYALAAYTAHNYLSQIAPPAPPSANPPAKSS